MLLLYYHFCPPVEGLLLSNVVVYWVARGGEEVGIVVVGLPCQVEICEFMKDHEFSWKSEGSGSRLKLGG